MKRGVDATGDRDNLVLAGAAGGLAVLAVGGVWVCEHLAAVLAGTPRPTADPLRLFLAVVSGRQPWPTAATLVAAGLAVVLLVLSSARSWCGRRVDGGCGRTCRPATWAAVAMSTTSPPPAPRGSGNG